MTAKPLRHRRTLEDRAVDTFVYVFIAIVFFATFYPFFLSIVLSFNEGKDATYGGIYFWPRKFTFDNYRELLRDTSWGNALLVSISRTVLGTIGTVFTTSVVAYGLSHRDLIGRKLYMGLFIFAMYFSGGIIPYYMVLKTLGLINNFLVFIIPGMLSMFYVLVSISFFESIPKDLAESARLDGAGEMGIFVKVIYPLSLPLLATIAIFTAVGQWNSWYDVAFFTQDKGLRTMAYQLMAIIRKSSIGQNAAVDAYASTLMDQTITNMSVQLAAMIVAVAPILCVYPFFQRFFVSGLSLGSVKG